MRLPAAPSQPCSSAGCTGGLAALAAARARTPVRA